MKGFFDLVIYVVRSQILMRILTRHRCVDIENSKEGGFLRIHPLFINQKLEVYDPLRPNNHISYFDK